MTVSDVDRQPLVGGALALDFANTASGRDAARPFERLHTAADLVAWAAHAGSIDAVKAGECRAALAADGDIAPAILQHALQLREAIYRIGAAITRGDAPPRRDLAVLKDAARRAIGPAELAPTSGGGYAFDFSAAPAEVALLGPVAWSAIDLLATASFDRIKQCPGDDCGWLFVDRSKNNSRRWCDMSTCGNRTKGKRHRERR